MDRWIDGCIGRINGLDRCVEEMIGLHASVGTYAMLCNREVQCTVKVVARQYMAAARSASGGTQRQVDRWTGGHVGGGPAMHAFSFRPVAYL